MGSCYFCGHDLPESLEVRRSTSCPSCGKDVKICLNCGFYAPEAHWECRETIPEPVAEKDRANFCDYFALSRHRRTPVSREAADKARTQFDTLFGNG